MTKPVLEKQSSLELNDYMNHLYFDEEEEGEPNAKDSDLSVPGYSTFQSINSKNQIELCNKMSKMKAPTMVIKSVSVGRPLKTLSFLTNWMVIFFSFLSTSGSNWILTSNFRVGLWEECVHDLNDSLKITCNRTPTYKGYVRVFIVSSVLGLILTMISTILLGYGMKTKEIRKTNVYNTVIILHIFEVVLFLISLIGYPISFIWNTTFSQREHIQGKLWGIGWSYVMGWLGIIAICVSTGLLYFDRDAEEIIYYEKICKSSYQLAFD